MATWPARPAKMQRAARRCARCLPPLLACVLVAPLAAQPQARMLGLCADIEPRQGLRTAPPGCYAGAPCIVLLHDPQAQAQGLDIQAMPGSARRLGPGAALPGHCPRPAAAADPATRLAVRLDAAVPGQALVLRRPAALGPGSPAQRLALPVDPGRGFLDPRQPAASEQGRAGEGRLYTFTGRGLEALRLRADAPVPRSGADAARIQWLAPDGRQIRIHLAPPRPGLLSTDELFEFSGHPAPALNRDLGWPVIQVHPAQ